MIDIQGVVKSYGAQTVLRGVNLHVPDGMFMTLVGGNGAGKTTLLRIVAGLLQPTAGSVLVGGWPLATHAEKVRQHIGLVSHQSMLYGDLSAAENLLFFARLYGLKNPTERVTAVLKLVGLWARQRDAVRTFSRGMVQRLTIARATLHEPEVLLLDEPYTGLDQEASQLLDDLLLRERANGRTILLITHDLSHGLALSHRVAILHAGQVVYEAQSDAVSPAEFLTIYNQRGLPKAGEANR